jgi:hypothetical protein
MKRAKTLGNKKPKCSRRLRRPARELISVQLLKRDANAVAGRLFCAQGEKRLDDFDAVRLTESHAKDGKINSEEETYTDDRLIRRR